MVKAKTTRSSRIVQGDIIRNVEYVEYISERAGQLEVSKIVFPLVVVLTQDCDLAQDYTFRWRRAAATTEDKWLLSVLVAPLYNVEHIYTGVHLSELKMKMQVIPRDATMGKLLRSNQNPRYHYLDFGPEIPIVPSVVDFKQYFSVNVTYLKKLKVSNFVCQLSSLYREDLSHRFSSFLARIGLPE